MICEKELRRELKRLPKLFRQALKDKDLDGAYEILHTQQTLEWLLEENCECGGNE